MKEKEKAKEEPKPKEPDMVERANEAAARLEKANAELKENIAKMESLRAEKILGGKAEAGNEKKDMTADEKVTAEARAFLKKVGLREDAIK